MYILSRTLFSGISNDGLTSVHSYHGRPKREWSKNLQSKNETEYLSASDKLSTNGGVVNAVKFKRA